MEIEMISIFFLYTNIQYNDSTNCLSVKIKVYLNIINIMVYETRTLYDAFTSVLQYFLS